MRLKLSGGSDDIIETEFFNGQKTVSDEIYLKSLTDGNRKLDADVMVLKVTTVGGARGCKVYVIYDGCWSFTPAFLEDGRGFPDDWEFTIGKEHEYSSSLTIEADETIVLDYEGKEDAEAD